MSSQTMNDLAYPKLKFASHDPYCFARDSWISRKILAWFPNAEWTDDLAQADIIFHSYYNAEWRDHLDAIAVEIAWENEYPDFNLADFAISFFRLSFGNRYLRLPNFCLYPEFYTLFDDQGRVLPCDAHAEAKAKTRFCTCVVSNGYRDPMCEQLFQALNAYRPVDSGGAWHNSFGGERVKDKGAFLRTGKFTFACENSATPDYVTEKIVQAFAAHTVPIYWDAPNVSEDFNPAAFIDCSKFPSVEAVIEEVKRLDADDAAYEAMLAAPLFKDGRCPEAFSTERLREFLTPIFTRPLEESKRFRGNPIRRWRRWERERQAFPLLKKRKKAIQHALKMTFSKVYQKACAFLCWY